MTPPPFPAAAIAAARDATKAHLRTLSNEEDALIAQLAASAMSLCEAFTGTAIIARDWSELLDVRPGWQQLSGSLVYAIGMIEGLPVEGAAFVLPASDYAIDIDAEGTGWVRVMAAGAAGRVRVAYGAGSATGWADLPPPIAQGIVLLSAHLFDARESGAVPPAAVTALWRPWRRLRLGAARHRAMGA